MSYGREIRIENLGVGLVQDIADTDLPPGAALVEDNMSLGELGAIEKRSGFTRRIPERFTDTVKAVVPIEDAFGRRFYIVAAADLRIAKK